jgi:hypothetical protein
VPDFSVYNGAIAAPAATTAAASGATACAAGAVTEDAVICAPAGIADTITAAATVAFTKRFITIPKKKPTATDVDAVGSS